MKNIFEDEELRYQIFMVYVGGFLCLIVFLIVVSWLYPR